MSKKSASKRLKRPRISKKVKSRQLNQLPEPVVITVDSALPEIPALESAPREMTELEKEAIRRSVYADLYDSPYPTTKDKYMKTLKERL